MRNEQRRNGSTLHDAAMVTLYVCIDRRVGNSFSKKEGLVALLSERSELSSQRLNINELRIKKVHINELHINDTRNLA